jgi:hypothetical protein
MTTRRIACSLCLILFSAAAWGQTRGGGGGRAANASPSPVRLNPTPSGSFNAAAPGSVPVNSANDEGKIEFRTQTILIQIPVVALDKSGNHIHGLTKEDLRTAKSRRSPPSRKLSPPTRNCLW